MIPGRIQHATRFLGAPAGWDEARDGLCDTLPIRDIPGDDGVNQMMSAWLPWPEELEALAAGAAVALSVFGSGHPPVMLSVLGAPAGAVSAADRLERLETALKEIAAGNGVYGAQALEYKNIARVALGMERLG